MSPAYPVSGYATNPPPAPYPPIPSGAMVPAGAAFAAMPIGAVDPLTGQAWSDKSRSSAGLLQLLPALFFAIGGIGRLYAGNMALGITQICLTVVGWVSFWCGFALILPWFISGGLWLWFVIDGIVMLAGRPVDAQGRPLRY